jgi:hypothetical protein
MSHQSRPWILRRTTLLASGGRMVNLLDRKAKFDSVKYDLKAVQFHMQRYDNGSVDVLAKQCFQYWQQLKNNPKYKALTEKMEAE